MSEQIDWSKAPEWATKHGISGAFKSQVWFDDKKYTYVDGQQGGKEFFYADACTYAAKDFSQVSERPATPSWSGEGLPPVGVVCEMHYCGEWEKTEILCIGVKHVFIRQIAVTGEAFECSLNLSACQFRHIRTPEQIAADAREAYIRRMQSGTESLGFDEYEICATLYDKGLRFQD